MINAYLCEKEQNMLTLNDSLNNLSSFKTRYGQKYDIRRIGIFGSVARKENNNDSDIDIVVELENPSLSKMYELRQNLQSLFNCKVDLVRFRDSLRSNFKSNIMRDAIYV